MTSLLIISGFRLPLRFQKISRYRGQRPVLHIDLPVQLTHSGVTDAALEEGKRLVEASVVAERRLANDEAGVVWRKRVLIIVKHGVFGIRQQTVCGVRGGHIDLAVCKGLVEQA